MEEKDAMGSLVEISMSEEMCTEMVFDSALEWLAIMCLCTETAGKKKVERSVFNSVYKIKSVKTVVLLELLE